MTRFAIIAVLLCMLSSASFAVPVRVKNLVNIEGVRGNDLLGYGLVIGLHGSGDTIRNSPFTEDIMNGILEKLGVSITNETIRPKNVAAVLVTATLPPFARSGSQIDVNVAAIGDAKSIMGGTLVMTPLNAADGEVYAVSQGPILSGGVEARGETASVTQGVPTTGFIPRGARVERELDFDLSQADEIRLALRNPDFTTASRIEDAINRRFGKPLANLTDPGTVSIDTLSVSNMDPAHLIGQIENIEIEPESIARVVIDDKSGTILIGEDVRISQVAISQGNLTLRVRERLEVSQPNPFAPGETIIVPSTQADITEEPGIGFSEVQGGASLAEVISGLNALGVRPRDMIDILKVVHTSGALHAELIIN